MLTRKSTEVSSARGRRVSRNSPTSRLTRPVTSLLGRTVDRRSFLKSAGLRSIEQAKIQADKKGDVYVAVIDRPGRPAPEVDHGQADQDESDHRERREAPEVRAVGVGVGRGDVDAEQQRGDAERTR